MAFGGREPSRAKSLSAGSLSRERDHAPEQQRDRLFGSLSLSERHLLTDASALRKGAVNRLAEHLQAERLSQYRELQVLRQFLVEHTGHEHDSRTGCSGLP